MTRDLLVTAVTSRDYFLALMRPFVVLVLFLIMLEAIAYFSWLKTGPSNPPGTPQVPHTSYLLESGFLVAAAAMFFWTSAFSWRWTAAGAAIVAGSVMVRRWAESHFYQAAYTSLFSQTFSGEGAAQPDPVLIATEKVAHFSLFLHLAASSLMLLLAAVCAVRCRRRYDTYLISQVRQPGGTSVGRLSLSSECVACRGIDCIERLANRGRSALVITPTTTRSLFLPANVTASATPNPNAMKFTLDRKLTDGKSQTFSSAAAAAGNALAERLFAVAGVASVFLLNDFVTVSKSAEASWDELAPAVAEALASHFE